MKSSDRFKSIWILWTPLVSRRSRMDPAVVSDAMKLLGKAEGARADSLTGLHVIELYKESKT